eukprot:1580524-Rhodomonas_salina.1
MPRRVRLTPREKNTRNCSRGTNCTEIAVSCIGFRGVGELRVEIGEGRLERRPLLLLQGCVL